jgi:hypothetical protein
MKQIRASLRASSTVADRVAVAALAIPALLEIVGSGVATSWHMCPPPEWAVSIIFPLVPMLFLGGGLVAMLVGALARRKRAIVSGVFGVVCCLGSFPVGLAVLISIPCGGFGDFPSVA